MIKVTATIIPNVTFKYWMAITISTIAIIVHVTFQYMMAITISTIAIIISAQFKIPQFLSFYIPMLFITISIFILQILYKYNFFNIFHVFKFYDLKYILIFTRTQVKKRQLIFSYFIKYKFFN